VIDETFAFDKMSKAYAKVGKMRGRGKVVVDMEKFGELCVD